MAGPRAINQYERVQQKLNEGLPVGEAIKAAADELGVAPGTIHTSYYRVRSEMSPMRAAGTRISASVEEGTPSDELVQIAFDALQELAERNKQLEQKSAQLERIQRALSEE